MNHHEGVICDACSKANFRGRRYKCLVCFDYDLCADCYEKGKTSVYHLKDHPMQCILTLSDFELFFGGEFVGPAEPSTLTFPYEMEFNDVPSLDPIPAVGPSRGNQNMLTDNFANGLAMEQRGGPQQELINFLDELPSIRRGRRMRRRLAHDPHLHRTFPAWAPLGRESIYPIPELLPQSALRRGAIQSTQLDPLQREMQAEVPQGERLPRRLHPILPASPSSNPNIHVVDLFVVNPFSRGTPVFGDVSNRSFLGGRTDTAIGASAVSGLNRPTGRTASVCGFTQQPQSNAAPNAFNIKEIVLNASAASALTDKANANSATGGTGNADAKTEEVTVPLPFMLTKYTHPTLEDAERADMEREQANRSEFVQALLLSLDLATDVHMGTNTIDENKDKSDTSSSESHADVLDDVPLNIDASVQTTNPGFEINQQRNQHQQTSPEDFADKFKPLQQPYLLKKKPIGKSGIPVPGGRALVKRETLPSPALGSATATSSQPPQRQQQLYRQAPAAKSASNQIPDTQ